MQKGREDLSRQAAKPPRTRQKKFVLLCAFLARASSPRAKPLRETVLRLAFLVFLFLSFSASADLVVVQATTSAPNQAERNYATSMTRNMGRWLTDVGLVHRVINDDAVTDASLASARVVILPYNPKPPPAELAALKRFVTRGGKLIVFFGGSPELAAAMGLRLGDYVRADTDGQWAAIRMQNMPSVLCLPPAIQQNSKNIRPALPSAKGSAVLGYWENVSGKPSPLPGITLSPAGFWMSHVLLADADLERKGRLLLAMVGHCDPGVWAGVAGKLLREETRLGASPDFPSTLRYIRTQAAQLPNSDAANLALNQAQSLHQRATELIKKGRYPEAIMTIGPIREQLLVAFAAAQVSRRGEFRGVWDHSGKGLYPGEWNKTAVILKKAGFTDVFSNVLWPWMVHGKLKSVPESVATVQVGDQIQQGLTACHRVGMKFHAWKVCWKVDGAPAPLMADYKKAGRLQVNAKGVTIPWLCPSQPINRQSELNAILETARRYPVDGIHLDYIRYESPSSCYCVKCRLLFEKQSGREATRWPADVASGARKAEYDTWRAERITTFVRDVRVGVSAINSNIIISAAVYGHYPHCGRSIAQDWGVWIQKGYIHYACPMDYFDDLATFTSYVQRQVGIPGTKGRIYPGIGVTASESRLDAAQVIEQINSTRRHGAAGFMLFDLNPVLEKEILPYLTLGVMKP